jgi:hypothetical protein
MYSALNLRAPVVVKAGPARIAKLIVIGGGRGALFVINDAPSLAEAMLAKCGLRCRPRERGDRRNH